MRCLFALATGLLLLVGCTQEDRGGFNPPPVTAAPGPSPTDIDLRFPPELVRIKAPGGLRFQPASVEIRSGNLADFMLVNQDGQEHTLVISELAVVMLAAPSQTVSSTIAVDRKNEGEFAFFCSISGHREAGMEGTITVS